MFPVSTGRWVLSGLLALSLLPAHAQRATPSAKGGVAAWVTTPDQSQLLKAQSGKLAFGKAAPTGPAIEIDDAQTFQTMDGFGYCLTGGSAELLHAMSAPARARLLRELFGTAGNGIGVSYLRLSIGASDLDATVFSYDDRPAGETDPQLTHFSLAPDEPHLIPVLKEILAINPKIKLMGSPWSPPTWMKTNGESKGGSLRPEFYGAYAQYFVKYLQGMQKHGIALDAITVQNEPLHPGNNPSLLMLAAQQAEFVGRHLGPAFKVSGLKTKIICYDHNADKPEYPLTVLGDAGANPYVDGSAFHLYAGPIETLSKVHDAYPTKNVYFTEQWTGSKTTFAGNLGWHVKNLEIGAPRNWAKCVLEWNLAADPQQNPHTPGGCTECLGALTLAPGDAVTRNVAYYTVAHASKFVPTGSVRIGSTAATGLPNVAYRTPTGQHVLLVVNEQNVVQSFSLVYKKQAAATTLPAGAVATYVW
ncbi:MAG TPA: glycoside hydrolase family 30 beta sandwich domain-containing protein [Hymenobacter sp.]|uniref:glycoside hydrolase family 30 protein n=1 Tax=Hymenobacter sp. TaxID=1898978 RepID=UPI002D7EDDC2|nr:glycoside hydrolase family 30 beta sandwich domain-containing protein [Hymenobacter sp.]HET9503174.1 glycoside hydrolase family 30 beta sandwich domain-containing protein [Hymenobacter sp.]